MCKFQDQKRAHSHTFNFVNNKNNQTKLRSVLIFSRVTKGRHQEINAIFRAGGGRTHNLVYLTSWRPSKKLHFSIVANIGHSVYFICLLLRQQFGTAYRTRGLLKGLYKAIAWQPHYLELVYPCRSTTLHFNLKCCGFITLQLIHVTGVAFCSHMGLTE